MKKIFSFLLIAAGLMIGTQSKAQNTVSVTIDGEVTEYATLEDAVAAAVTAGEGVIKLLPAYNRYPQAWLTGLTIETPIVYTENDKGLYTFHAFNPNGTNSDESAYQKKLDGDPLSSSEETRIKAIYSEINPNLDAAGLDAAMADIKSLHGFADWRTDFEVYFDADMDSADYTLAGNYGTYGWIPNYLFKSLSSDMLAYEKVCLINNEKTQWRDDNLHYYELMTNVFNFHCGIISKNADKNAGKTFWCELYLYKPGNNSIKILLDRTPYTFPIRPVVVHSQAEETPENADVLAELKEVNEGVKAMTEEQTNIENATSEFETGAEKCVVVVLTEVVMESSGSVYTEDLESTTFDVTPKYKDANGVLVTIPNEAITDSITFRLPVVSAYADKSVAIYHRASEMAEEDFVGVFPVQELEGSYFVELKAKEFSKYTIKEVKNYYERETYNGMIGTICLPYDVTIHPDSAKGAVFYELNYRNNAVEASVTEVSGPAVETKLVGGKAYVFEATGDTLRCEWAPSAVAKEVVTTGAMVGNLSETPIYPASVVSTSYVITSTGVFRPCGEGAYVPMNRAYLNMSKLPAPSTAPVRSGRYIVLSPNGANVTTEIEEVQNAGCRMQNGKMMINGQFVIMKGGKMFNALGTEL